MTVTAASLKLAHPEFNKASDALVNDNIDDAIAEICSDVVPTAQYDKVVEFMACDLLARSPFAINLKLVLKDGSTIYEREYIKRANAHGRAERVAP